VVKQTIEISVFPGVFVSLELFHVDEDFERSDAPERDQKVEEKGQIGRVIVCDFV